MSHLKIIIPALFLSTIVLTTGTAQADYQNEIGLYTYQTEDADNDTSDGTSLFYSYYFNSVDTSKGPWAEAAFINRAGSIGLSLSRSDSSFSTTKAESTSSFIGVEIANPDSDFYFAINHHSGETDYKSSTSTYKSENTGYGASVGYFIQKYTLITFSHDESETEYTGLSQGLAYDSDTNSVIAQLLILKGNSTALSLTAGYIVREDSDDDEFKTTYLSGNYYLNSRLGIGGGLSTYSSNIDAAKGKSYNVNINYYFNPQVRIGLLYSQFKPDNDKGTESEVAQLTGSFYF